MVEVKKVCILTSAHQPFDARIFHKQAKTLAQAGYEVTLIAQHDRNETVDGITIVALPSVQNRAKRILGTLRVFKLALKQKAQVYHFHDPELLPIGILLIIFTKGKVIYDIHEYYAKTILFKNWIPGLFRKPLSWLFDKTEMLLAVRLSAIITVTEPMLERFRKHKIPSVAICNFPDLQVMLRIKDRVNQCGDSNCFSIIYTGRLSKAKGFTTILQAMKLVVEQEPTAICAFLATMDNLAWLDEAHSEIMDMLHSKGALLFLGRLPHHEVFEYMQVSAIGWKPGPLYQEGISTKTIEYMACGKPVIVSDLPLTADIIREAQCGILVEPCDASAHASAILYLLNHPEEAKQMGENGRKAVMEKYNWKIESEKLLGLYRILCE